jgi:hypothetical protein
LKRAGHGNEFFLKVEKTGNVFLPLRQKSFSKSRKSLLLSPGHLGALKLSFNGGLIKYATSVG